MQRFLIGSLVLASTITHAQVANPQTLIYEAVTAHSPTSISRLRITQVDTDTYALHLSIVAPNPSQHTGQIQGLATRNGERYTLRVPNFADGGMLDTPALCTMVIDVDAAQARVVSDHQCAGHHGAGASFVEQGNNLVRVTPPA